jgi:uroporphyrinogen-III synthase
MDNLPVLITRPEPEASDTAARVTLLGRRPVLAPLLRIEPRPAALPRPGSIAAVLVTSGNALGALPEAYQAVPLLTVGHATARRARQAGFKAVETADGDAQALAALAQDRMRPVDGTLLLASGLGQGIALAATLRAAGYRVVRRVTYAALPATMLPGSAATLLQDSEAHVALFFSAETARTYVRLVQRARLSDRVKTCEAVAIGGPAAVALEGLPWRGIRVAARPNQDEMLALLQ